MSAVDDDLRAADLEAVNATPRSSAKPDGWARLVDVLQADQIDLIGTLAYNTMSLRETADGESINDAMVLRARYGIERNHGLRFGKHEIMDAITLIAHRNCYNPVQDYLTSLVWDSVPRLDIACRELLNNNDGLSQCLVSRWFVSIVARALMPGAKCDTALILIGEEGTRKSMFFQTIAGDGYHTATHVKITNKELGFKLARFWLWEMAELATMKRAGRDAFWSFMSDPDDTFRKPWGVAYETLARHWGVVGTANGKGVIDDEQGGSGRRFLCVEVPSRIDIDKVSAWRDQLLAEAVVRYNDGMQWWLDDDEETQHKIRNQEYISEDPWADRIVGYLDDRNTTTVSKILDMLGKDMKDFSKADASRIIGVLKRAGWRSHTDGRKREWVRK